MEPDLTSLGLETSNHPPPECLPHKSSPFGRLVQSGSPSRPGLHPLPAGDRQWETIIPRLQKDLPELFVLGDYAAENRTGPGIWLRCVVAGKVEEYKEFLDPEVNKLPVIIYLPGVSRRDMRAVESCPEPLKPIADLRPSHAASHRRLRDKGT
jgi:hypothetical protein